MKLNKIFTAHMVFAAGKPIRIFGEGKGKAQIEFAGQYRELVSKENEWFTEFLPMGYGGPFELKFSTEEKTIILEDIYIGEVYLFAGQSNMQLKLNETNTPKEKFRDNNLLRFFTIDRPEEGDIYNSDHGWMVCKEKEVGDRSALGFLVGDEISLSKNIAVGAICCYQGGSVIESWVPEGIFEKAGIDILFEEKSYDHKYMWNSEGRLYNDMLSMIFPFSVSAVIWYQGEADSNKTEGVVYMKELCILIDAWRESFKDEQLPFVIIQLADFIKWEDKEGWKQVQKAQEEIEYVKAYVKTVVSADVCENDDIHPKTKEKLAKRIVKGVSRI